MSDTTLPVNPRDYFVLDVTSTSSKIALVAFGIFAGYGAATFATDLIKIYQESKDLKKLKKTVDKATEALNDLNDKKQRFTVVSND